MKSDSRIEATNTFKIHNAVYENMTAIEKTELIEKYHMFALDHEAFSGYWLLIPKGEEI